MSNHPDLSAVLAAEIPTNAKLLYSALYARTNGAMSGAVAVAQLIDELGVAPGTLRNLRTILTPWAVTAIERGVFLFVLQSAPESQREKSAVQREKSDVQRANLHADENDENGERAESAVQRAESAVQRADLHANPPTPPYVEEELINPSETETTPPPPHPPTTAEQQRTCDLLSDGAVGMSWAKIRACQHVPFADVLAHTLAWAAENAAIVRAGKGRPLNAGALAVRIRDWPAPVLTWRTEQVEFVQQHAPELLADPEPERAETGTEFCAPRVDDTEECAIAVPCGDGDLPASEIWARAVAQLRYQMYRGTWDAWARVTLLVDWRPGTSDVAVLRCSTPYVSALLAARLRTSIERTLASIVGRVVEIEFAGAADFADTSGDLGGSNPSKSS